MKKIIEEKVTWGGPCIYRQAFYDDGTKSGNIQDIGQSREKLEVEFLESVSSGRDDVRSFVDRITTPSN